MDSGAIYLEGPGGSLSYLGRMEGGEVETTAPRDLTGELAAVEGGILRLRETIEKGKKSRLLATARRGKGVTREQIERAEKGLRQLEAYRERLLAGSPPVKR
jgi:hypothetical protein